MVTRVIYDNEGTIFNLMETNQVVEPVGIPFMVVEVPEGKFIERIDVSGEEHVPVFGEHPPSEVELLREEINGLNNALLDVYEIVLFGGM